MKIKFHKCIQDSQVYGSTNEHMVSRIFFAIDDESYECNVRQPYGENFSFEDNPIEVETPEELKGKVNYEQFRDAVESYYRLCVGKNAKFLNISGGQNIRMYNNTFTLEHSEEIDEAGFEGGW